MIKYTLQVHYSLKGIGGFWKKLMICCKTMDL